MFMSQRRTLIALCAVAVSALLLLPDVSSAQFFGRGGRGYGGYRGWGGAYGGWGNYGYGNPYYTGYGYSSPGYWSSPYYGGTWGGTYVTPGNWNYNPQPYNYSTPTFNGGYSNTVSTQSAYPPDGRSQMPAERNRALIDVHVPPNAQVSFDGSPTQQQGAERHFMTPPLDPNSQYTYNVTAKWMDQTGKERRDSRTVRLTPGQRTEVNFLTPQNNSDQNLEETRQPLRQQPLQPQQQQPKIPPTTPPDR
jgi:uncharacterized protein (TIGR03000 family)